MSTNIIGNRIKELRKSLGYSQEELAKVLREDYNLETPRTTISRWESGFQVPETYKLKCLATEFGVSMEYISGLSPYDHEEDKPSAKKDLVKELENMTEEKASILLQLSRMPESRLDKLVKLFCIE